MGMLGNLELLSIYVMTLETFKFKLKTKQTANTVLNRQNPQTDSASLYPITVCKSFLFFLLFIFF